MHRLSINLNLIRKQRWRMSQDRFAQLLNSTRSKINSYENGGVEPSIAFILSLEKLTNISVHDLFYGVLKEEQIPPFPLEEGQTFSFEKTLQNNKESELSELIKVQRSTQEMLITINDKINEIRNAIKRGGH